ncbi:MAG: GNAT family N-acetyltransferase [Cyclobacteriaceae bacterium]|nr:GNAT family N-acetyltransferase [Cyclobacteriaceae bacterium HetDA_MAG_MS6]
MIVRKVTKQDIPGLKEVLDSSGLFPSEHLDEMISNYLDNPDHEDIWFTTVEGDTNLAIGYCAPETFTEGTYNLYAIGVLKEQQGKGIGKGMMGYIENQLKERSTRVLIVETSSSDEFKLTRKFYRDLGYHHEATIRDFWQEGENKEVFWKKLQQK